jgi:transcriptional regulator with XRE-family HTH domain
VDRERVVREFRRKHKCKVVEIQEAAGVHESDYYRWLKGQIPDHYSTCINIERVLYVGLPKRRPREFS